MSCRHLPDDPVPGPCSSALFSAFFANALTLAAQQPPAATPADQSQTARLGPAASGVVVDVVVRDKKGRPVSNLTAGDFAFYEDGDPQKVVAFEPYTPADAPLRAKTPRTRLVWWRPRPPRHGDSRRGRRSSRWRGTNWSRKDGRLPIGRRGD